MVVIHIILPLRKDTIQAAVRFEVLDKAWPIGRCAIAAQHHDKGADFQMADVDQMVRITIGRRHGKTDRFR